MDAFIAALIAAPVVIFLVCWYTKKQTSSRGAAIPATLVSYPVRFGAPASAGRPAPAPRVAASSPAPAYGVSPVTAVPRRLNVPGEDLGKVAHRLAEPERYSDADILVVGGGDSAVEAALALCRSGKNRVTLA